MSTIDLDILLGDKSDMKGYRCSQFSRDSAPLVAPRFSDGRQGETDLDLLKSESLESLAGGMFQRDWADSEMVARAMGIFNPFDKNIYPTPPPNTVSLTGFDSYPPLLKAESQNYSFYAGSYAASGDFYNQLVKVNPDGTHTKITLPTNLQGGGGRAPITGLTLHKGSLYIGAQAFGKVNDLWRYDIDPGTFQNISPGIGNRFFTLRGSLYLINADSTIFSATNEKAASQALYYPITDVGFKDETSVPTDVEEFNSAAWICKPDGIYRFDGVYCVKIFNLVTLQLKAFNGALYFVSGNWLYKFDGTNLSKIQFFGKQEYIGKISLSATNDFLFIRSTASSSWAQGDKPTTQNFVTRIYTYDGAAFMLLNETPYTSGTIPTQALVQCGNKIHEINSTYLSQYTTTAQYFDMDKAFDPTAVTAFSHIEFTTSEYHAGYPNIFKALEFLDFNYSNMISGDSISVWYQTFDGKAWSSTNTLATLTSTSDQRIELQDNTKKLFKRIKIGFVVSLASGSTLSVKGLSMRYTLQPRPRWRWNIGIMAEGLSTKDRNNNNLTTSANKLNNQINAAIKNKTPSILCTGDYSKIAAGVNSSALVFTVQGEVTFYQDPYLEYPLCAVKNNSGVWEILRVTNAVYAAGVTTITVLERGYLGISAGTINTDAEFRSAYKVYVTRLIRDNVDFSPNTVDEQTTGESQQKRLPIVEIVEV